MKPKSQIKPQEELSKLSKEELKIYIDNLQKELQKQKTVDDTTKSLVENFVLSKYIYLAAVQNKPLVQVQQEFPKLNLVGITKNGKIEYFGFGQNITNEISKAQKILISNLEIDHNKYIYNTLKTKYPNLAIEYINGTILPPQKLEANIISKGNSKTQEKPQNLDKIGKLMKILDVLSNQNGLIINHIYITREHDKSIMRQTDYIAIYITVEGVSKTILINDEYGEGSFIIDDYLDQESLITLDKSFYTGFELKYDKNELDWLGKFRDKILDKRDSLTSGTGKASKNKENPRLQEKINKINEIIKLYNDKEAIYEFEYDSNGTEGFIYKGNMDGIIKNHNIYSCFVKKYGNDIPGSIHGFYGLFFEETKEKLKKYGVKYSGGYFKYIIEQFIKKNNNSTNKQFLNFKDWDIIKDAYDNVRFEKIQKVLELFRDKETIYKFNYISGSFQNNNYTHEGNFESVLADQQKLSFFSKIYTDINIPKSRQGFSIFFDDSFKDGLDILPSHVIEIVKLYIQKNKNPKNHELLKNDDWLQIKNLNTLKMNKILDLLNSNEVFEFNYHYNGNYKTMKTTKCKGRFVDFCYNRAKFQGFADAYNANINFGDFRFFVEDGIAIKNYIISKVAKLIIEKYKEKNNDDNLKPRLLNEEERNQINNFNEKNGDLGLNKKELSKEEYMLYYKNIFDSEKFGGIVKIGKLKQEQIVNLKIDKLGVKAIATNIGRNYTDKENNPKVLGGFHKMLCYIYNIKEEELHAIINKNK